MLFVFLFSSCNKIDDSFESTEHYAEIVNDLVLSGTEENFVYKTILHGTVNEETWRNIALEIEKKPQEFDSILRKYLSNDTRIGFLEFSENLYLLSRKYSAISDEEDLLADYLKFNEVPHVSHFSGGCKVKCDKSYDTCKTNAQSSFGANWTGAIFIGGSVSLYTMNPAGVFGGVFGGGIASGIKYGSDINNCKRTRDTCKQNCQP